MAAGVLLLLSLTASGCWGRREIEERSFVRILGVDMGSTARLRVTASIALPRTVQQGPGGGAESPPSLVLTAEGSDITDALNRIETLSSRQLTGQHITCLILGEDFAREDIAPIMDVFERSIEFRPTTLVAVCREKAEDFIQNVKTPEESEPADYIVKIIETGNRALGFCPVVTIHNFSERYQTSEFSPWAPYLDLAALAPPDENNADGPAPSGESEEKEPVPAAILGTALFALNDGKYRMVGRLDQEETRAALLMYGRAKAWYLDLQSPGDQETLTLLMTHKSVNVHVDRRGEAVKAKFTIRVSGAVEEYVVNPDALPVTNEVRLALAQTAQERIGQLCAASFNKMMSLGCDGIALGKSVHGTFRTMPEWEAFDWASKISNSTATFDIKVDVYSTGFTFQRASPR